MTGKRIAALIAGVVVLLSVVGNAMSGDPDMVRGLLVSIAGAFLGLMTGLLIRRKSDSRSLWIPLAAAIGGAIVGNWIGVLTGLQYSGANPDEALSRVTGRGFGEGFLYGGALFLVIYGLKGPYRRGENQREVLQGETS